MCNYIDFLPRVSRVSDVLWHGYDQCLTLYRMVMPIGTPFLKEKNNN